MKEESFNNSDHSIALDYLQKADKLIVMRRIGNTDIKVDTDFDNKCKRLGFIVATEKYYI